MSKSRYQNVFHKNPVIGIDLLNRLLRREISPSKAAKIFNDNGIKAKERNIQIIIKNMREKQNTQSTPNINPVQSRTKAIVKHDPSQEITKIRREYESFDFSKIPNIDPIKLLDKHIYELENLLLMYPNDAVTQKHIIELEMKIADKIFKMRPTDTEFNINDVLRKNDYSTEFIVQMDSLFYPGIKSKWLKFLSEKER